MKILKYTLIFLLILGATICFGDDSIEFRLAYREKRPNTTVYTFNYQTIFIENKPSLVLSDLLQIDVIVGEEEPPPWLKKTDQDPNISVRNKQIKFKVFFNDNGKNKLVKITSANIGNRLAIFIDNEITMAPTIQDKIDAGEATITTGYTEYEARKFAKKVNELIRKE